MRKQKKKRTRLNLRVMPGSVDRVYFLFKLGCGKQLPSPVVGGNRLHFSL